MNTEPRKKPLLKKQHKQARLKFAKAYLDETFDYRKRFCGQAKPKLGLLVKMRSAMFGENQFEEKT